MNAENPKPEAAPAPAAPRTRIAKPARRRAKGGAGPTGARKTALAGELTESVRLLRQVLRESAERFLANTDALLDDAIQRLEGTETSGAKAFVPPAKVSRDLIDEIAGLSVKPEKGRVKDLARLKRAAESVAKAISEAD